VSGEEQLEVAVMVEVQAQEAQALAAVVQGGRCRPSRNVWSPMLHHRQARLPEEEVEPPFVSTRSSHPSRSRSARTAPQPQ
jgi:hypothetical protein